MSTFEFTIRILGGLLSSYYLSEDERLARKALEAGEVVYAAFSNSTSFPHVFCYRNLTPSLVLIILKPFYVVLYDWLGKSALENKGGTLFQQ